MSIRNLSNLMYVAELRYVQSLYECGQVQGPDTYVRHFIPLLRRWRLNGLNRKQLAELRANPFYYYLIARTKYYDDIFHDAVEDNFKSIINIGCGGDTRSYRFGRLFKKHGIRVLECDQALVIAGRLRAAKRLKSFCNISYAAIDLNGDAETKFAHWLNRTNSRKVLVMMEGVSPYIDREAFGRFLRGLALMLPAGSRLVYDFKLCGCADGFGCTRRTGTTFRLPPELSEIAMYHEERGFRLYHAELSSDLTVRVLPGLDPHVDLFRQDCLVQLEVM
jgi:methyltransferase (TIGR00027 family)